MSHDDATPPQTHVRTYGRTDIRVATAVTHENADERLRHLAAYRHFRHAVDGAVEVGRTAAQNTHKAVRQAAGQVNM